MDCDILSVFLLLIQVAVAEGSPHTQTFNWSPLVIPVLFVSILILVCLGCFCCPRKIRNEQSLVDREHGEAGGGEAGGGENDLGSTSNLGWDLQGVIVQDNDLTKGKEGDCTSKEDHLVEDDSKEPKAIEHVPGDVCLEIKEPATKYNTCNDEEPDKDHEQRSSPIINTQDIVQTFKEDLHHQDQCDEEPENWENELLDEDGAEEKYDTCGDEWSPVVIDIFNENTVAEQEDQEKEPKENWESELLDTANGAEEISDTCGDERCSSINMKIKSMRESSVVIEIYEDRTGAETRSQEENQKSKIKRSWGSRVSLVEQGLLVEESCYDLISC